MPPKKSAGPSGKQLTDSSTAQSRKQVMVSSEPRITRSTSKQGQLLNPESSGHTTAPVENRQNLRTRSDHTNWEEVEVAINNIQAELKKIHELVPSRVVVAQTNSSQYNRKVVNRNVIEEIDNFYSAFIQDDQFEVAMSKESSAPQPPRPNDRPAGRFINYIYDDLRIDLKTREDGLSDIIRGGMSLVYGEDDRAAGDQDGQESDFEADREADLWNKVNSLDAVVQEVQDLASRSVVSQSFSTIKKKHYQRLGVAEKKTVSASKLCLVVINSISSGVRGIRFSQSWERVLKEMEERMVKTIEDFWNILSEESTRLLVNDFKFALVAASVMRAATASKILCFPEFSLGSQPKPSAKDAKVQAGTAVTIKNKANHATRLSGSTDYFTISSANEDSIRSLKKVRSEWNGSATMLYDRLAEIWSINSGGFVLVEAKSPLTRLESHIPQVVAEAIALGHSRAKLYVPFCLTSGAQWIFGVVCGGDTQRHFWKTSTIPFRPTVGGILVLMALLFTWVSLEPEELWDMGD